MACAVCEPRSISARRQDDTVNYYEWHGASIYLRKVRNNGKREKESRGEKKGVKKITPAGVRKALLREI